jgi:hypothetical protein
MSLADPPKLNGLNVTAGFAAGENAEVDRVLPGKDLRQPVPDQRSLSRDSRKLCLQQLGIR